AVAGVAWMLDDGAVAAAARARLGERKQPLALGDHAAAVADRADDRRRARLGARAAADAARGRHLDRDLRLQPAQRVLEGEVHGYLEIRSTLRLSPASAAASCAAAEEAAEEVAEIAEVVVAAGVAEVEVARIEPRAAAVAAECVVLLALLRVGERVVRVLDLLELLLGGGVARVLVRVVLGGELAVGLLDLLRRRALLHAERVVERCHLLPLGRRRDDDPRRADHLVAELVALLHHFDDGALFPAGRLREQRSVPVRAELPVGLDLR